MCVVCSSSSSAPDLRGVKESVVYWTVLVGALGYVFPFGESWDLVCEVSQFGDVCVDGFRC